MPVYGEEVQQANKPAIKVVSTKGKTAPPSHDKKLYVTFNKSKHLTEFIKKNLADRGYTITEQKEDSDCHLYLTGIFKISGKDFSSGTVEFSEIDKFAYNPDGEKKITTSLLHAGVTAVTPGMTLISITELATWLSQVSGISGFVNKLITGDPRGVCLHENCDKIEQRAVVTISILDNDGRSQHVGMKIASVFDDKVVIDQVIDRVLAETIETFTPSNNK